LKYLNLDPKGANNQLKDKFDSVIRSHQQADADTSELRSRDDFEEADDISLEDDTTSNDNNNSSGGAGGIELEDSDIMNQDQ
jgi:hypothetical protein